MQRRYPLLILLSLVAILACIIAGPYEPQGLPFSSTVTDSRTAVIAPISGIPLPPNLQAGDKIDLPALDLDTRIGLIQASPPAGHEYRIVIRRDSGDVTVPITTGRLDGEKYASWIVWPVRGLAVLNGVIVLLLLWRGRDLAARWMTLWIITCLVGNTLFLMHWDGIPGLTLTTLAWLLYLVARLGFYMLMESVIGSALGPKVRFLFRMTFAAALLAGATVLPSGLLVYAATGWAELMRPDYGYFMIAGYLVPTVMLAVSYGSADISQRLKLRWMLWSSALFIFGVYAGDTFAFGFLPSVIANVVGELLGLAGFGYTLLRHRLVDVSVIIDRTLVYGATTAIVVGVVTAMNSLALRATLGESTGLFLQIIIPLALGIVLGRVRKFLDWAVERVFFRRKYLSERSLRAFARHAGHIDEVGSLLESTVREITRNVGTPGVALYSVEANGMRRLSQQGSFPMGVDINDAALVALRAERKAIELEEYPGKLGEDGCLFPMMVLGNLRGAIVCRNRPGEHYGPDEKRLLMAVAREVGAAWRILRARENEEILRALAEGRIKPAVARVRAQKIFSGASAD